MSSTKDDVEFRMLPVSREQRDEMRDLRDELGLQSYGSLIEEMRAQFDPSKGENA